MRQLALVSTLIGLAIILAARSSAAQIPGVDHLSANAQFRGEIGSFAEAYSVSGREQRRPSGTGRLFLRSQLQLGGINVGFDLLYSTEGNSEVTLGSSGRQPLNQFSIAPEWRWGRAYLGSFNDSYSSLTWDGVRVQGVGVDLTPGVLRLAAFHGRAQRAVAGGAVDGAYRRVLSGARIGYGRRAQSSTSGFVDLVFLRATDDASSLPRPMTSEVTAEPSQNAFAVTPEENMVVAAVTRVPIWKSRVIWSGEAAASLHARDRRAPRISDEALDDYAGLLRAGIKPRASTYGDIAHKAQIELRNMNLPGGTAKSPRTLTASLGYRYVGAGYVSLGLASLPADQQAVTASMSMRFRTWNASLQGLQQHDNLLGQKLATTNRNHVALSLSAKPSQLLSASLRASINTVANDADELNRRIDYTSMNVGTTLTMNLGQKQRVRGMAFTYGYQQTGDESPLRASSKVRAHDVNLRSTVELSRSLSMIPGIGIAATKPGDTSWQLRSAYSFTAQHRAAQGRLSTTGSVSNSRLNGTNAIQGGVTARYRASPSDLLTISGRHNRVSGLQTASGRFNENAITVQWQRAL